MTTTPATPVTPDDKWQAAWDALPDGMHAFERARQAGINALGQAHSLPGDVGTAETLDDLVNKPVGGDFALRAFNVVRCLAKAEFRSELDRHDAREL